MPRQLIWFMRFQYFSLATLSSSVLQPFRRVMRNEPLIRGSVSAIIIGFADHGTDPESGGSGVLLPAVAIRISCSCLVTVCLAAARAPYKWADATVTTRRRTRQVLATGDTCIFPGLVWCANGSLRESSKSWFHRYRKRHGQSCNPGLPRENHLTLCG